MRSCGWNRRVTLVHAGGQRSPLLDELPEFGRDFLEALRQPLEDGQVSIARVGRATRFPAAYP